MSTPCSTARSSIELRRIAAGALDQAATRRIVAALVRQGFDGRAVFARLRQRGAEGDDDSGG